MYIIWILLLHLVTLANHDWNWLKDGMLIYAGCELLLIVLWIILTSVYKNKRILPMSYAGFSFVLYLWSLFLFLQKMIGAAKTVNGRSIEMSGVGQGWELLSTLIGAVIVMASVCFLCSILDSMILRICGLASFLLIPLMLLVCHFSPVVNGAHISIFGVLILGPLMVMLPFAVTWVLNVRLFNRPQSSVRISPFVLLAWLGFCCMLAVWNHELGTVLILGSAGGLVSLSELKGRKEKWTIIIIVCILLVLIGIFVPNVHSRIIQTFDTYNIVYTNPDDFNSTIVENAQKLLIRVTGLFAYGYYGAGYGTVSVKQNFQRNTDYVIQSAGYELGIIFLFVFLFISVLGGILLREYASSAGKDFTEVAMLKTACLLFLVPIIYIPLANFGILPLTGISYPFLADGKSVFWAYSALAGIIVGIYEKHRNFWRR